MIRIFIGYDQNEVAAYTVLSHSIIANCSEPVSISPVKLSHLQDIFNRDSDPMQSTEFSFSRFLVPHLSEYEGWSIFLDCDMLALHDFSNLWKLRDPRYAVMCVKHDYEPKEATKFLGHQQTKYQKKNWSSVMMFNNAKCKALSPEYVNQATGLELHQFKWLQNEDLIGELPGCWNYLVGCGQDNSNVSLVHYTIGGPYFVEYANCEFAEEWFEAKKTSEFVNSQKVASVAIPK